jgi:hypothetical protein
VTALYASIGLIYYQRWYEVGIQVTAPTAIELAYLGYSAPKGPGAFLRLKMPGHDFDSCAFEWITQVEHEI